MTWFFVFGLAALSSVSLASDAITYISAGGVDGGGGKGVYCEANGLRTVESLDLYEAKRVWGYTLPDTGSFGAEIRRVMPQYWNARNDQDPTRPTPQYREADFQQFLEFYEASFQRHMRFIAEGTRIRPTEDATLILDPPPHCRIVQVLVYLDEGSGTGGILVDREYWDLLNNQNKLAFVLHEMDYKNYRNALGLRSSDLIRKYIGAIFSTDHAPNPVEAVRYAEEALKCESTPIKPDWFPTIFYVTPIKDAPDWAASPKSNLHFVTITQGLGSKKGPVPYKATSILSMNMLNGESKDTGYSEETIDVDSILGGTKLRLKATFDCSGNSSACRPASFTLSKKENTGSVLEEPFTCQRITPYGR